MWVDRYTWSTMLVLLIYEYLSLCKSSDNKMLGICIVAVESHRDVQGISQRDGQHTSSEVMDYQTICIVTQYLPDSRIFHTSLHVTSAAIKSSWLCTICILQPKISVSIKHQGRSNSSMIGRHSAGSTTMIWSNHSIRSVWLQMPAVGLSPTP